MDESGDLGFNFKKSKTSRFFIVTFVFVKEKNNINNIVKKIFKDFTKTEVKNHTGTLHAYKENPKTRKKLLNLFHQKKIGDIVVIYLDKNKLYTRLQDQKHILYNYITNILLGRVLSKKLISTQEKVTLIASRRETNKFLNSNFLLI